MQRGMFPIVAVIIAGLGVMAGYGIHWTGVETRLLPPEAGSFRDAFEQARTLIHEWEEEEGLDTHSEPQIAIGDALERYLDDWRRNRGVP